MTRDEAKNVIANMMLIEAFAGGEEIQYKPLDTWIDTTNPGFYKSPSLYRIKPKEPRSVWKLEYQSVAGGWFLAGPSFESRNDAQHYGGQCYSTGDRWRIVEFKECIQ